MRIRNLAGGSFDVGGFLGGILLSSLRFSVRVGFLSRSILDGTVTNQYMEASNSLRSSLPAFLLMVSFALLRLVPC